MATEKEKQMENKTPTIQSIKIPKYKIDLLKKAIEKLNRKARKLECEPMVLEFTETTPFKTDIHPITGNKMLSEMVIEMVIATLTYIIPNIDGWELIAKMDIFSSDNGSEVLISAVPNKKIPEQYQNLDKIHCDHCGYNRMRNHSILIRNMETSEYMQVGSTCVKDFFNGNDPQSALFMSSILLHGIVGGISDEDSFGGRWSESNGFDIETVLLVTAASIKKFGWMSKSKADTYMCQSTSDHVFDNLMPYPKMPEDNFVHPDDDDKILVEKAIEYWVNVNATNNDYLMNCQKLLKLGYVPFKFMGYACSMISTYQREMEFIAKREAAKTTTEPSNYVGNLGERLKGITVNVIFVKEIASDWGCSVLYTFQDVLGNIYKTFYSGSGWSAQKDDKIIIDGTVKKHDEFKGEKQTMLNRVSAKKAPSEAFTADEFKVV